MRSWLIAVLALAGCGDKAPTEQPAAPATQAAAVTEAPKVDPAMAKKLGEAAEKLKNPPELKQILEDGKGVANTLAQPGEGPTAEELEKLLLAMNTCKVDDDGIERECAANKAWREARKTRGTLAKDWGGMMSGLGQKHIKNESPAVRIQAASLMGSIFGATNESQQAIIDAAQAEKDPRSSRPCCGRCRRASRRTTPCGSSCWPRPATPTIRCAWRWWAPSPRPGPARPRALSRKPLK